MTIAAMPSTENVGEAYVWAFFTGEGVGGEKISLAASKGNDALSWNTLNNGTPLYSTEGEEGLRDPFIIESKDGDKFYMLATDLKISGRSTANGLSGFSGAQANGSLYIEVWESNDLVNWSNQRHIKVNTDYAGNTWAPEAYWDSELNTYVVYWASNIYTDDTPLARKALTYNRMMYVTTDDFITFTDPPGLIDVDRRGQAGVLYLTSRFKKSTACTTAFTRTKNSMTLRQEKSTNLLSTVTTAYPAPLRVRRMCGLLLVRRSVTARRHMADLSQR